MQSKTATLQQIFSKIVKLLLRLQRTAIDYNFTLTNFIVCGVVA